MKVRRTLPTKTSAPSGKLGTPNIRSFSVLRPHCPLYPTASDDPARKVGAIDDIAGMFRYPVDPSLTKDYNGPRRRYRRLPPPQLDDNDHYHCRWQRPRHHYTNSTTTVTMPITTIVDESTLSHNVIRRRRSRHLQWCHHPQPRHLYNIRLSILAYASMFFFFTPPALMATTAHTYDADGGHHHQSTTSTYDRRRDNDSHIGITNDHQR